VKPRQSDGHVADGPLADEHVFDEHVTELAKPPVLGGRARFVYGNRERMNP
jgi:hypothetical protein